MPAPAPVCPLALAPVQGHAGGDVEIHRAQNGQAAAAGVAVGETEVARGVIVRRGACAAERLSRGGAGAQCRPVGRGGLCLHIDRLPIALYPRSVIDVELNVGTIAVNITCDIVSWVGAVLVFRPVLIRSVGILNCFLTTAR